MYLQALSILPPPKSSVSFKISSSLLLAKFCSFAPPIDCSPLGEFEFPKKPSSTELASTTKPVNFPKEELPKKVKTNKKKLFQRQRKIPEVHRPLFMGFRREICF